MAVKYKTFFAGNRIDNISAVILQIDIDDLRLIADKKRETLFIKPQELLKNIVAIEEKARNEKAEEEKVESDNVDYVSTYEKS